jgi:outer membrane immunogenic protein
LVGCVVAASLAATQAWAADLPVAAPIAPAYHPPIYDWTGVYVGGHFGGGWMNDTVTYPTLTAPPIVPAGAQIKLSPMGVLGGAQVGANIEFAPVVVGVEGTWTASMISGSDITPGLIAGGSSEKATSNATSEATVAARIGYAANDLLFYVKGGGAWMRVDYTQQVFSGPGSAFNTLQTITDTRAGFVVGGGFEYGINENLSLKVEYDYLGFGTKNYTFNNLAYGVTVNNVTLGHPLGPQPVSVQSQLMMVTAGVNYRFTWQ